jgi:hypothetical protein
MAFAPEPVFMADSYRYQAVGALVSTRHRQLYGTWAGQDFVMSRLL